MKSSIDRKILTTNVTEIRTRTRRELRTDNWEREMTTEPAARYLELFFSCAPTVENAAAECSRFRNTSCPWSKTQVPCGLHALSSRSPWSWFIRENSWPVCATLHQRYGIDLCHFLQL